MPLQWKKLCDYAIEDAAGRFRVCRTRVHGAWGYTAWRRVTRQEEKAGDGVPSVQWEPICYSADPIVTKHACDTATGVAA